MHYLIVPVRTRVDIETDLPMRLSAIGLARTAVVEMWLRYMAEMEVQLDARVYLAARG